MWLTIGGRQYRDGELTLAEVVGRLGEGVSTSGPAPGELAAAIERSDEGDGVAVLTVSRRMSAVFGSAELAAKMLEDRAVSVVDTRTAAGGQALVVLAAARAARRGAGLPDVVAAAGEAAAKARLLATLPSLEYLARGGRVPGAAAWGARWLGLNPLFEFVDGRARPLRPARSREQACARIVASLKASAPSSGGPGRSAGASHLHVAALHALEPELAERMLGEVDRTLEPASAFAVSFSPVMIAHTGPGLAGLAWWWD